MTNPKRIYLDNAATSFPKPPAVHEAMVDYATRLGASPGRGGYAESLEAGRLLHDTRVQLADLINAPDPNHIIFTLNCSDALNLAIKGLARPGDHFITTELDHNSILRPLNTLADAKVITQTRIACDPATGLVDPDAIRAAITPRTRLIATLHASNVTGTLQDVAAIGRIARERDVHFLVDAAQTLGHLPLDVQAMNIDLLAAPGHKGLLGPLGTGLLYIRPGVEKKLHTLREGGTGSVSELDRQPDFMPDRFEPGSHNTIGLVGLAEGVRHILHQGVEKLWNHEQRLMRAFLGALAEQPDHAAALRLYGPPSTAHRCAVFSVRIEGIDDPARLSSLLESRYGILTRSGLHCAPGAHAMLGTAAQGGATRLSFGAFNTERDARFAAEALLRIASRGAAAAV